VTVLVPLWVARAYDVRLALDATTLALVMRLAGIGVIALGLTLVASSIRWFARQGKGTLAPWDPPRALVVGGPYRYVRNPMISGVVFVLIGEAIALRSLPHGVWALTFLAINVTYIPLLEEPMLRHRFGAAYDEYRRHVPGLVPRARPWTPEGNTEDDR